MNDSTTRRSDRANRFSRFMAASLLGVGALSGCQGRHLAADAACDDACAQVDLTENTAAEPTVVQRQVTAAWEADRQGESAAALAGYQAVLRSDPNNAWAKKRVEALSAAESVAGQTLLATSTQQQPTAHPPAAQRPKQTLASRTGEFEPGVAVGNAVPSNPQMSVPSSPAFPERDLPATGTAASTPSANPFLADFKPAARPTTKPQPQPQPQPSPSFEWAPESVANVSFQSDASPATVQTAVGGSGRLRALLNDLASPLPIERRRALEEIGQFGPAGRSATVAVELLLQDEDARVVAEAAWTHYQITGHPDTAVAVLATLVNGPVREAAAMAVQSLGLIGPSARASLPSLQMAASRQPGVTSIRAVEAILRIDPADPVAPRVLIEATRSGRPLERAEAVYALGFVPSTASGTVVPALSNALQDADEAVRTAAALTLGAFAEDAEPARTALLSVSRFDTEPVREAARATLACLPR